MSNALLGVGTPPTHMQKTAFLFGGRSKPQPPVAPPPQTLRFANRNWTLGKKEDYADHAESVYVSMGKGKGQGPYYLAEGEKATFHNWQDEARKLQAKGIPGEEIRAQLSKRAAQESHNQRVMRLERERNVADPDRQRRIREKIERTNIKLPAGMVRGGNPDFVSGIQYGGKGWSNTGTGKHMRIDHNYHDGVEQMMQSYGPFYPGEKAAALLGVAQVPGDLEAAMALEKEAFFQAAMTPLRWASSAGVAIGKPLVRAGAAASRGVLGPIASGGFRTAGRIARAPFRHVVNAPKGKRMSRAMRVAVPGLVGYDLINQGQQWARAGTYGNPSNLRRLGKPLMGAGVPPRPPAPGQMAR